MWRADEDVLKNTLKGKVNKKRPLGRSRTRWKTIVENDMRLIDGSVTLDWTLNREKWGGLLMAALVLNGPLICLKKKKKKTVILLIMNYFKAKTFTIISCRISKIKN